MAVFEQLSVQSNLPIGRAGEVTTSATKTSLSDLPKSAGRSAAISQQTITTPGNDAEVWTMSLQGEVLEVLLEVGGAPTAADVTAALLLEAENNPIYNGYATFAVSGAGPNEIFTVTHRTSGEELNFTLTPSPSGAASAVDTAPADAEDIGYGVPVYRGTDALTGETIGTSINPNEANLLAFMGISVYHTNNATKALYSTAVAYGESMHVEFMRGGHILVAGGASAANGDPVYIGVSADGEANEFFNAAGGARVLLSDAEWVSPHKIELRRGL